MPTRFPAFRAPQSTKAHWNGWLVDRLLDLVGPGLEPHPDPWGF
ncbi:hypothetical protein [Saccharothrix sp. S26]|nr:hypothetical protein [Saccharothrix sp. S26]